MHLRTCAPALPCSSALLSSVDRSPALEGKLVTGGRLNVAQAVAALHGISAPAPRVAFSADLVLLEDTYFSANTLYGQVRPSRNVTYFELTNDPQTAQACRCACQVAGLLLRCLMPALDWACLQLASPCSCLLNPPAAAVSPHDRDACQQRSWCHKFGFGPSDVNRSLLRISHIRWPGAHLQGGLRHQAGRQAGTHSSRHAAQATWHTGARL